MKIKTEDLSPKLFIKPSLGRGETSLCDFFRSFFSIRPKKVGFTTNCRFFQSQAFFTDHMPFCCWLWPFSLLIIVFYLNLLLRRLRFFWNLSFSDSVLFTSFPLIADIFHGCGHFLTIAYCLIRPRASWLSFVPTPPRKKLKFHPWIKTKICEKIY